ncbi:S9 family peptidase [Prevotella sp.]|uniref:S9 family peptidase n=1 Tax=Prevotella sp. TaxID=59823 RepID=UPI002F941CF9
MKRIISLCAAMLFAAFQLMAIEKLTIADITSGKFAAKGISDIRPVSGTDLYTCISDDNSKIEAYSFKTGKKSSVLLDLQNTQGESIKEIDGYIPSPDGTRLLIQTKTKRIYRRSFTAEYYIYTIKTRKLERLSVNGPQQTPVWSPDGHQVAFVRSNNIYLVKLLYDNAETQVTKDGKFNEIINGIPDWVNEEEFSTNSSLVFNADGTMLCWLKYDERNVKEYSLQLFEGSHPTLRRYGTYPGFYTYKYPKAGEQNAKVSAWAYDIQSHKINQLQVPLDEDGYMPRIKATVNPNQIVVFTMNRHQDVLNLYSVNPRTTLSQLLIKEASDKYVKEEAMEGILIGKQSILLPSDRDGYMHLYEYSLNGSLKRKIGDGEYDITEVYGFDEKSGDVYFQAATLNSHDRQIYVAHKNGKMERLTAKEGWNEAIFSGDFQFFINTWSDYNTPYRYSILSKSGKEIVVLEDNAALASLVGEYGFVKREAFSFVTKNGTQLDGWMVKPLDFDASKEYPVILHQYSGPGSQQVKNSWSAGSMGQGGAFDSYLAQQGFIVVSVDGRGTGGRGAEFEKCTYLNLGVLEAEDQVETALWLGKQSYVDASAIGIWGWSFGGFNTLMSMSTGDAVFKAGVAIAPPTNWKFYDTVYTERYMRTPKENPEGYGENPIRRAEKLSGALLLCHGMADDNVHPQNSFEYAEALVQADKDFKEIYYTNRNHSIYGGNTRNHLLRQVSNFFITHLKK